ncbi:maltose-binding protein MalE [Bacillus ectoiniformans]|uniref:FixH family protein n=1 Tax=Bacillus ectoiniformans TaxID=1494429 RepID=UPI001EF92EAD|nr:FixH family protein [Bacillus ectoiniformans]MBM7647595.1 maltose-binding protein MalE [Bacillus ectoiniformans]
MHKKFLMILFAAGLAILMSGCTDKKEESKNQGPPQPIEANLTVPETAAINEKVTFKTAVSQGEEAVEDADEVMYEVWEEGAKETSEMLEAKMEKGGIYTAEKTFEKDAVYHVQVHVTARGLHTMPKKQIVAGNPELGAVPAANPDDDKEGEAEGHH